MTNWWIDGIPQYWGRSTWSLATTKEALKEKVNLDKQKWNKGIRGGRRGGKRSEKSWASRKRGFIKSSKEVKSSHKISPINFKNTQIRLKQLFKHSY